MDSVILALSLLITALLVLAPPVAVWRSVSRRPRGARAWPGPALWLLAPFAVAYVFVAAAWIFQYEGLCGGWLGETTRCGLGQYAGETLLWAAMGMAMPGLAGIVLGIAVLVFRLVGRRVSRTDS